MKVSLIILIGAFFRRPAGFYSLNRAFARWPEGDWARPFNILRMRIEVSAPAAEALV